jgi:uncharacterized protein YlxW (UPF0749 family)
LESSYTGVFESAVCQEIHGPDFAWDTKPIDGVPAYKAGHGKKHGRYLFGDGMISTPTVLSEVQLSEAASGSPDGQPHQRRRPNADDVQSSEQQLQEEMERHLQQQREEMEQKLKQEREEIDRKVH